ncbi:MAG: carbohydrate kinase family protein [Thermoflexales bacterium]
MPDSPPPSASDQPPSAGWPPVLVAIRERAPRLVCYGDLVTDLVIAVERLPIEADRVQAIRAVQVEPGGAGNFLITAARLGAQALALGTIGNDYYGQQTFNALAAEGVELRLVQRGEGTTNVLVLVIVDEAGRHVFLVREGEGPPLTLDAATRNAIRQADAFFLPGYALQEQRVRHCALEAAQIAVAAGVPLISDLGPIVSEASVRLAAEAITRLSTLSVLTADEAVRFTNATDAAAAARALQALGAQWVVLKRGPQGCTVYAPNGMTYVINGLPVPVQDTTAAGDAFDAALVAAWIACGDVARAAAFANCVGAAKVQKLGSGRQCPTLAEIAHTCATQGVVL